MIITWSLEGHHMVIVWSLYGHCMVITWSSHDHRMVFTWQERLSVSSAAAFAFFNSRAAATQLAWLVACTVYLSVADWLTHVAPIWLSDEVLVIDKRTKESPVRQTVSIVVEAVWKADFRSKSGHRSRL